jgi:hypothetical protein
MRLENDIQLKHSFQVLLLCVNVDFGGFAGRVLHDQEHFGDELNDVASL